MYCMHCGEEIAENSRYCKYCGKLVAEDEIRTVNINNNTVDENGENNNEAEESTEDVLKTEDTADIEEESCVDKILKEVKEKTEKDIKTQVVDDMFFEHMSTGKKTALFFGAVFMTAIIAVVVFALCFPQLI